MSQNCFGNLTPYDVLSCPIDQQADIDAVAILDQDHTIVDFDDAAQWQTEITALNAFIIKNVKAAIVEPAARETANSRVQGPDNVLTGWTFSITIEDPNVSPVNDVFYSNLNGRTTYAAVRLYYEGKIRVGLFPYYWQAKPVYGAAGEILRYMATGSVKVKPSDYLVEWDQPIGIFD